MSYEDFYPNNYKFAGMTVYRNLNLIKIDRKTYDGLNLLGDVGGLDGILVLIGFVLTARFQDFTLNKFLLRNLFFSLELPKPKMKKS
mgnify:CR=1 FL=1